MAAAAAFDAAAEGDALSLKNALDAGVDTEEANAVRSRDHVLSGGSVLSLQATLLTAAAEQ